MACNEPITVLGPSAICHLISVHYLEISLGASMTLFARAAWKLDAVCGVRALLATCAGARGVHTKHADLAGAKDNPYLEKYKARIEEVQG